MRISPLAVVCGMLAFVALTLAAPRPARAHPDLDSAIASAQEAEFEVALAGFERALASGTLTRDELVTLLSERLLVLHALGKADALARDLAALAMIAPGHELGRRAPPQLADAFAQASAQQGAAVTISASCTPSSTGLHVAAEVTGLTDPSLARVTLRTESKPDTPVVHDASAVDIALRGGKQLSYSAELVGLGNVVLASDGGADAPKTCTAPNLLASQVDEDSGKGNRKMWWWVGAAGGVAVITAVVVGVVLATNDAPSSDTSVGRPLVTF